MVREKLERKVQWSGVISDPVPKKRNKILVLEPRLTVAIKRLPLRRPHRYVA